LFDGRLDLNAQFLFILLETRKFDGQNVVTGNQPRKVVLAFEVADGLNSLVTKPFRA
jgi:hypothetical protein